MPARPDTETLLATILEGIGLPFYAVDKDWRVYLYNTAAERHFAVPAEKMIGTVIWDHFPQEPDAERGHILHDAMAQRATVEGETLSLTGRYVSYEIFPLADGLGVFFRDITDRREARRSGRKPRRRCANGQPTSRPCSRRFPQRSGSPPTASSAT
jgi:PAS domain-containing protein